MSDSDHVIASLRAELSACQDKLNNLPVDWDTENDALKRENDELRKQVSLLAEQLQRLSKVVVLGD